MQEVFSQMSKLSPPSTMHSIFCNPSPDRVKTSRDRYGVFRLPDRCPPHPREAQTH